MDEPEVHFSTDVENYVPLPEGGAANYNALLELSRVELDDSAFRELARLTRDLGKLELAERKALVLEHRDLILANYTAIERVLPRIHELSEAAVIGDASVRVDCEIVRFQVLRQVSLTLCLYTELSHWDSELDDNSEDLLALLRLNRNWAPHTRVLVHTMISVVIIGQVVDTYQRVLPEMHSEDRQQLEEELSDAIDYVALVSNALWAEYCIAANGLVEISQQGGARLPFLFHRNRTLNIYGRHVDAVAGYAAVRDWIGLDAHNERFFFHELDSLHIQNHIGWTFLAMSVPASSKVMQNAEAKNAKEAELLQQLRETPIQ
ncbi:MAG: hypothetical protein ACPGES_02235 [Coraliomargarita sp.]